MVDEYESVREIIGKEIMEYLSQPFSSQIKRIDDIIGKDSFGRFIILFKYKDEGSSELQIVSIYTDPLENYGIKVHGYLEDLKHIITDEEFIDLLSKGYVHLKLMKDKDRKSFKEVTIYVPYYYRCSFEGCKIPYSPADFISFLEKKIGSYSKIRKKKISDIEDLGNIELFDKVYSRISTSFSEDREFQELSLLDDKLRAIQENYVHGYAHESQKVYGLSRDGLRKYIGYTSEGSGEVLFVSIPLLGSKEYTYVPAIVKEIKQDDNEIKIKVLSPSFYPLPMERIISQNAVSYDPLSFILFKGKL